MEESGPKPQRGSLGAFILAALALGGSAVGMLVYQTLQEDKASSLPDTSGFDIKEVDGGKSPLPSGSVPAQAKPPLAAAPLKMEGLHFDAQAQPASGAPPAAPSFKESVWNSEKLVRNIAIAYTKKYPLIAQYGRDWMSCPDLKKLNDDYMKDRDPVKFMKGVARSKNFGSLVKKYAGAPPIQSFVQEALAKAPGGAVSAGMDYLKQDGGVKQLVANVAAALGLPPGLLTGAMSGGKVDEKKVMERIMQQSEEPRFQ